MSDSNDSKDFASIDMNQLEAVTGGTSNPIGGSDNNIDVLLNQLNSINGSLNDFKHKTNGLDSTSMMMLCALAMRNNQSRSDTVVIANGGGGCHGWGW